ncbi:acetyl-CoA C-acetyltransferase [Nocardioides halotolerans]|uniref:acetyl-CoA C-acetyltransferase n=1 Tax=Nocardioides halotolerans TaxID=433660 RepID=UPI00040E014F|nr:acetyl-CoA C-acetyltransferase [Nocardioides halotolerans]
MTSQPLAQGSDVVVCAPLRTPIGRYGGVFKRLTAVDLGVTVLRALLDSTGVSPGDVDDVILGQCNGNSEAPAIGRVVALDAGLPTSVPGMHIDRRCGSGLQAILNAAMTVGAGAAQLVVAGGTESMSSASFYSTDVRWGAGRAGVRMHDSLVRARETSGGRDHPVPGGMIETAENLRRRYDIARSAQDELAVESHRRAVEAQESGVMAEEIAPVSLPDGTVVAIDEHPRAGTSVDELAMLRPVLIRTDADATVTAGNASGQNDAAAMALVTTRSRADQLGIEPLLQITSWAVAGVGPEVMGIGPVPATRLALDRAGLTMDDLDTIELNEAFAAQVLAVFSEWGVTPDDRLRINPHGSGISLGHPVGATGTRMVGAVGRQLRRTGGRHGLVTMCIGGGQGMAAVLSATV